MAIHCQALKAGVDAQEFETETHESETTLKPKRVAGPVGLPARHIERWKARQHEVSYKVSKHVLDRPHEWPKKFVDDALHKLNQPVVENVCDAEAFCCEEKIDAAPLPEPIVNRLQEAYDRFQAQAIDDSDVPIPEVAQEVKHVREAQHVREVRGIWDLVERINHGLQCVVGGRGADCVGCSRGADVISDEDRLVPLWWKSRLKGTERAAPTIPEADYKAGRGRS